MIKYIFFTLITFFSSISLAEIRIENAWVKNAPPVAPARAAYFKMVNTSNKQISIIKMSSPQFNMIDAHKTVYKNGVYSMHPLQNFTVAPNSSINFKPKGKHLMLMMPTQPLSSLKSIDITLETDTGEIIQISAPIKD